MKRLAAPLLFFVCGCSTAPVADFLDFVKPGRIDTSKPAYGGVGAPPMIDAPLAEPGIPPPPVPIQP